MTLEILIKAKEDTIKILEARIEELEESLMEDINITAWLKEREAKDNALKTYLEEITMNTGRAYELLKE